MVFIAVPKGASPNFMIVAVKSAEGFDLQYTYTASRILCEK